MTRLAIALAIGLTGLAATALAHPGHDAGSLHWLQDPSHAGILVLLGFAFGPVISLRLRAAFETAAADEADEETQS